VTPTFQGEVQFRRWSDSSTQGVQVTFALPDSGELEPLKGKEGKRFMAVLVEIGDDEQPVQPQRKDQRGPLCKEATDLCKLPDFREFMRSQGMYVETEADAADYMKIGLGISSRKELDTGPAGKRFISLYRIPFFAWQHDRRRCS
jgi:hypothetical protein